MLSFMTRMLNHLPSFSALGIFIVQENIFEGNGFVSFLPSIQYFSQEWVISFLFFAR